MFIKKHCDARGFLLQNNRQGFDWNNLGSQRLISMSIDQEDNQKNEGVYKPNSD